MIKVAIVEDEKQERELLEQFTKDFFNENHEEVDVISFSDGADIVAEYPDKLDILLLDIEMDRLNGIDTAKKIREFDGRVIILFITNMVQFALEGYAVDALDFVVKPIHYQSFKERLGRALTRIRKTKAEFIEIKCGKGKMFVEVNKITFVETSSKKVLIHTTGDDVCSSESMQSLEKKLEAYSFFRCHTAYLVNLNYIETMSSTELILRKTSIPISKYRKKEFLRVMANYMGGSL